MKKLNLKLGGIREMLSREQMKKVVGGYGEGVPDEPSGEGSGGSGAGYKCCWTGTTNCSTCKSEATSSWTCVSGATLTSC